MRWVQSSQIDYCILFNVLFHCLFQLDGFWVVTVLLKLFCMGEAVFAVLCGRHLLQSFYGVDICFIGFFLCGENFSLQFCVAKTCLTAILCVENLSHCNFVLLKTCPTAILCAENLPHCNFVWWKLVSLQFVWSKLVLFQLFFVSPTIYLV